MISYAQNFEDVMLARAFAGQAGGFYIDVGVCDAEVDSVTKHFYDLGWSGINVEPLPANMERIAAARPRDLNVCAAAGRQIGKLVFHEIAGTGLSTLDAEQARRHGEAGYAVKSIEVPVTTLAAICEQHVGDRVVDFLKVDVEGAEGEVIAGNDWRRWRPRVVLVEATLPLSREPAPIGWESDLTDNGYVFVYFDGLNRWYVRADEPQLQAAFGTPVNIFDDFVQHRGLQHHEQRVRHLETQVDLLDRRLQSAMSKADRWDSLNRSLLGKIVSRLVSRS